MKKWLVFWSWMFHDPSIIVGPETSERIFENRLECIEFVNTIAGHEVADMYGTFQFASSDGVIFKGGCIQNEQELDKLIIGLNFI